MVGGAVAPLLINKASVDPRFSAHPGLALYGIESYIAVPLNRLDGTYFGTLCALDTEPAQLSEADFDILQLLAQLIAFELEADEQQRRRDIQQRGENGF
ncbi:GAF domain-containing protein [Pseudomonas sp.]|uniref:GAF domain-containing protein n=1 Tax=Pseudomonas sp. TaxID=306 RepID=UPI0038621131